MSSFTRQSVYEWIWRRYPRGEHDRPSLDPTFQGMVSNAAGGPRSAAGTPLKRVSRGLYVLVGTETADGQLPETSSRDAGGSGSDAAQGHAVPDDSTTGAIAHHDPWSGIRSWVSGWFRHKDWAVFGIGVVLAGVLAVVGIAHVGWPWIVTLVCAITAVGGLATRALQQRKVKDRVRSLWTALAFSIAILLGLFAYHQWWDPALSPQSYQVILGGGDNDIFHPYDKAGGTQGFVYPTLLSQSTIDLQCYVSIPASGVWYRILDNGGWVPKDGVSSVPGLQFPTPPHC
jgi:hypothetical protein